MIPFRFLASMGAPSCYILAFILCTEFIGKHRRTVYVILFGIPFALGQLYLTVMAYFIRDWRHLQVTNPGLMLKGS